MQKESVLIIVGILVASTLLLFAADWLGITGKQTQQQNNDRIEQLREDISKLKEKIDKGENNLKKDLNEKENELKRLFAAIGKARDVAIEKNKPDPNGEENVHDFLNFIYTPLNTLWGLFTHEPGPGIEYEGKKPASQTPPNKEK